MPKNIVHITLLRHGRSRADDEKVHEGRYDSPLTDVGIKQASALADYWHDKWHDKQPDFEKIICSSLQRATKTAEIIANRLNLELEVSDKWMEFDNGPLAGMDREEAAQKYPIPDFRSRFDVLTKEGGESDSASRRRISEALEELMQSGCSNILIVGHGGSLNKAISILANSSNTIYAFGDTSFATLRYDKGSDTCVIMGINQNPHNPS